MSFLKRLFGGRGKGWDAEELEARLGGLPRPRIGIVTAYTTRKGLCTLARSIESVLSPPATVFPSPKIRHLDERFEKERADAVEPELVHDRVVPEGTRFVDWLRYQDIVIFIERLQPRVFGYCRKNGIRTVLSALLDYLPEREADRREALAAVDRIVFHSAQGAERLRADGLTHVRAVAAGLNWPCEPARPATDPRVFYFNIGTGGTQNRRNVPMVLDTFNRLLHKHSEAILVVKMLPQARKYYPDFGALNPRVRIVEGRRSPEEMIQLQRSADVSLFPSRFEGLGYPMLESLHLGVPVIATDAPPMNEIIREGENGLLIRARPASTFGLQTVWDLDASHFESQVERLMGSEGGRLLTRLKQGAASGNPPRQAEFAEGWARVVEELMPKGEDRPPDSSPRSR